MTFIVDNCAAIKEESESKAAFEKSLAEFNEWMADNQESLDAEFEKVLADNLWSLYEN